MIICRFCSKTIQDNEPFCSNCGYDPKTDTINQSFVRKTEVKRSSGKPSVVKKPISPWIKTSFVVVIIVTALSILFRYSFDIQLITVKAKHLYTKVIQLFSNDKKTGAKSAGKKITRSTKVNYGKNLIVEGIFFTPENIGYVIINDEIVQEGSSFKGVLIKKINEDSVEVVINGQTKVLEADQSISIAE